MDTQSPEEIESSLLDRLSPMRRALEDCRAAIRFAFGLTFVTTILSAAPILYMMSVFDRVLPTRSTITLVSLLAVVIAALAFSASVDWMYRRIMVRISMRIDWDMASTIFDGCFRRSLRNEDPNVHQVMGDLLTVRQFLTGSVLKAILEAPYAILFFVFGYLIHPLLALFMVVATVLILVIGFYQKTITTPALRAASQNALNANLLAAGALRNSETTMAMGMLPKVRERWHSLHHTFLHFHINSSEAGGFVSLFAGLFVRMLPIFQITVAVLLAGSGVISSGGVIGAMFIINRAIGPFRTVLQNWEDVVKARMAYERLDEIVAGEEELAEQTELPAPRGLIVAKDFSYSEPSNKRTILKDINFRIGAGESLAILGPNGSGKTTLLKAILGILPPSIGFMRLDGAEVYKWDHNFLGKHVGYVSQTPDLFVATVAENIARLEKADSEQLINASQLVGAHRMILQLPKGYDTVIGKGHHRLSTGQAQLISIARAVYMQPSVLILDEPTSNLDESTEKFFFNAVRYLKEKGSTIVFTTHKTNLLALADHVLVINEGEQVKFQKLADMLKEQAETREKNKLRKTRLLKKKVVVQPKEENS